MENNTTHSDKKRHMRMGIKVKSIAAISCLTMALAFSLMWMSIYHGSQSVREELLRRGSISATNLAYNATYATLIGDTTTIADLLGGIMAEKEVIYARVVEPNGGVLAERYRNELERHSMSGEGGRSCADDDTTTTRVSPVAFAEGEVHFQAPIYIRQPVNDGLEAEVGLYDIAAEAGPVSSTYRHVIGYAQIGMTQQYMEETISQMRSSMTWITILAVLIAVLATSAVVRMAIRPIRALVFATGRVAAGDYDCKVDEGRNDEIGDLADSFNKMTADLKDTRAALVEKDLLEAAYVELKEAQQQLVQAGKMAAIGQLAAGVAHEINNPLAGIMGYAQLTNEQLRLRSETGIRPDELPKFRNYIENMEKQSQRCKQIVQNLLRFARASSKEESERVNVNEIVVETLSFISHQMAAMQIEVETHLAADSPMINGHPGKLQQVFTNILINCIQAIKGIGTITITSEVLAGRVMVTIADTGEGIPEEHLEKIFEPFFTTKEIGQGTGLGLSVTYGLVRDMGGEVAVESKVDHGTTFTLTFPVPRENDAVSPEETDTQSLETGSSVHPQEGISS